MLRLHCLVEIIYGVKVFILDSIVIFLYILFFETSGALACTTAEYIKKGRLNLIDLNVFVYCRKGVLFDFRLVFDIDNRITARKNILL